jgi:hypothetical protein
LARPTTQGGARLSIKFKLPDAVLDNHETWTL